MRKLSKWFFGVLPWIVIAALAACLVAPTSYWFKINAIRVADSQHGKPPALDVDREIKRNFSAGWTATVRKAGKDGSFLMVCKASGVAEYERNAPVPTTPDLDWWTNPIRCNLEPGEYILTTKWTITILGVFAKDATITSNVFSITENGLRQATGSFAPPFVQGGATP